MKEIVTWLKDVETASQVYEQAAQIFEEDSTLKKLFTELAEEEAWHYSVMGSAIKFIGSSSDICPAVLIDNKVV